MDGPTLTVDLAALRHNLALLRAHTGAAVALLAAVKADAYGHGLEVVAAELERAGVDAFGVATADEALTLRRLGLGARILLFGPVRTSVAELVAAEVELTVTDAASLAAIEAARPAARARVHLKLDTGMGRLGRPAEEAVALARAIERSRWSELAALWTHLACADEPHADAPDGSTTRALERFDAALDAVARAGITVPLAHAANSAATLRLPQAHYGMVRPGIALYGHSATPAAARVLGAGAERLRPAATLQAPVTFVKRVRAGTPVSYGETWHAPHDTVIATVRLGYADGYPRAAGNVASAQLHGHEVPVAGRVCMDQLMLDVGALGDGVAPGDVVTFHGPEGPSTAELAARLGTISYELLTRSSAPRVARRYLGASG